MKPSHVEYFQAFTNASCCKTRNHPIITYPLLFWDFHYQTLERMERHKPKWIRPTKLMYFALVIVLKFPTTPQIGFLLSIGTPQNQELPWFVLNGTGFCCFAWLRTMPWIPIGMKISLWTTGPFSKRSLKRLSDCQRACHGDFWPGMWTWSTSIVNR